ncbi:LysR family transcriptional regulator [Babesia caballi]|uniref:LysR family transcriptional regulator n=1 Tax=Babesia caballi TaxID=5871 RepID=A0AAV4LQD0_BABCB|nr:LysR family transcriptional regulator [Babesia caballi]
MRNQKTIAVLRDLGLPKLNAATTLLEVLVNLVDGPALVHLVEKGVLTLAAGTLPDVADGAGVELRQTAMVEGVAAKVAAEQLAVALADVANGGVHVVASLIQRILLLAKSNDLEVLGLAHGTKPLLAVGLVDELQAADVVAVGAAITQKQHVTVIAIFLLAQLAALVVLDHVLVLVAQAVLTLKVAQVNLADALGVQEPGGR